MDEAAPLLDEINMESVNWWPLVVLFKSPEGDRLFTGWGQLAWGSGFPVPACLAFHYYPHLRYFTVGALLGISGRSLGTLNLVIRSWTYPMSTQCMLIEPWIEDRDTPNSSQFNHLYAPRRISSILWKPKQSLPAETFPFPLLCHYLLLNKMRPCCIMKIIIYDCLPQFNLWCDHITWLTL